MNPVPGVRPAIKTAERRYRFDAVFHARVEAVRHALDIPVEQVIATLEVDAMFQRDLTSGESETRG